MNLHSPRRPQRSCRKRASLAASCGLRRRLAATAKIGKQLIAVIAALLGTDAALAASDDIFMRTMPDGSVELSNVPAGGNYDLLVGAPPASRLPGVPAAPAKAAAGARHATLQSGVAQYRELVAAAARQAAVDARLLHAVIAVESGYNPHAVSVKGAVGLMQLMPDTARRYGIGNARDPEQNVHAGARCLRDLLKLFDNDVSLALAAYNAGENAVRRHGNRIPPFRETIAYVPRVLAIYRELEDLLI